MRFQLFLFIVILGLTLAAPAEKKASKQEEKSLEKGSQKQAEIKKATNAKPEKRGAEGEHEGSESQGAQYVAVSSEAPQHEYGPAPSAAPEVASAAEHHETSTEVSHHKPLVIEKEVYVHVKVPQPYPVEFVKHVPYPVQIPVPVVVHKPFPVPVPKPYHVEVEKKVPYTVEKHVPYEVKVPVKLPVRVPVEVNVPKPYPVHVPKPVPVPVPHHVHVPEYITKHEEPKLQVYKELQHFLPELYNYDQYKNEQKYETILPQQNYELSVPHNYGLTDNHHDSYESQGFATYSGTNYQEIPQHESYAGQQSHGHGTSYQDLKTY